MVNGAIVAPGRMGEVLVAEMWFAGALAVAEEGVHVQGST